MSRRPRKLGKNEGGAMEAQETTSKTEEMGTVCEVCPDEGTDKKASTYCTDCQQRFCSRCARIHSSQKASKQHKLIDIADMQKLLDSSIEELCESCLNMGESNLARMYCAECDEKLCVECSALHGKTKITKSHLRISIEEFKKTQQSLKVVCMQCNKNGEQTEASQYCPVCEKDLCLECTQIHKKFKFTKQHELMDIQSKHTELTRNKARVAILCEPCKNIRKNSIASDVCKECEEFLCEICARTHKRLKATKMHHLIKAENVLQEYCEPCMSNGDRLIASRLCKHCDELLCSSCSEMHASLKATKSHTLGNIPLKISDLHSCYPCKVSDREVNAVHHCAEREEFHCSTYGEVHGRKKAALSHNVVEVDKMGKSKNERDYKGGGIGLGELKSELEFDEIELDVLKSPFGEEKSDALESEFGKMELDKRQSELKYPPKSDRLKQKDMDKEKKPGVPYPRDVQSDSIELCWLRPSQDEQEYEIRYKEGPNSRWIRYTEFPDRACVRIKRLKSACSYTFKVRAVYEDGEGPYSPESKEITTKATLAATLLPLSVEVKKRKNGTPSIHRLPSTENKDARNHAAKTRKITLGRPPLTGTFEKTILLVGETGSGKSTLVDGFVNYLVGVNYDDPYRFTLVDLESDEKGKSQAFTQTEWVTCYTIHPSPGSRISYTLNIVDTPGFGDTRGLDRDKEIFEQLRQLFSSKGDQGVVFIDAVCFLMKAPNARLTSTQKYIFSSVLALFGKDMKNNICALITFADSKKPEVLSAINEAKLPIKLWYMFNNSGLFENNDPMSNARIFWEMGMESFQNFFQGIQIMKTKSLQQTKEVLQYRNRIEVTISNLQPLIDDGLRRQEEVRKEMKIIREHESNIAANRNFEYTVEERKVTNTYAETLNKYEAAKKEKLTHEQYMKHMKKDLDDIESTVLSRMREVHRCKTTLSEIALQPNILSMKEHTEQMIQASEMKKKEGFQERIDALKVHLEKIEIDEKVALFKKGNADKHC